MLSQRMYASEFVQARTNPVVIYAAGIFHIGIVLFGVSPMCDASGVPYLGTTDIFEHITENHLNYNAPAGESASNHPPFLNPRRNLMDMQMDALRLIHFVLRLSSASTSMVVAVSEHGLPLISYTPGEASGILKFRVRAWLHMIAFLRQRAAWELAVTLGLEGLTAITAYSSHAVWFNKAIIDSRSRLASLEGTATSTAANLAAPQAALWIPVIGLTASRWPTDKVLGVSARVLSIRDCKRGEDGLPLDDTEVAGSGEEVVFQTTERGEGWSSPTRDAGSRATGAAPSSSSPSSMAASVAVPKWKMGFLKTGKKRVYLTGYGGQPLPVEQYVIQAFTSCYDAVQCLKENSYRVPYQESLVDEQAVSVNQNSVTPKPPPLPFPLDCNSKDAWRAKANALTRDLTDYFVGSAAAMNATLKPWLLGNAMLARSLEYRQGFARVPICALAQAGLVLPILTPEAAKYCSEKLTYVADSQVGVDAGDKSAAMQWDLVCDGESGSSSSDETVPCNGWRGLHSENMFWTTLSAILLWEARYLDMRHLEEAMSTSSLAAYPAHSILHVVRLMTHPDQLELCDLVAASWKHPWQAYPLDSHINGQRKTLVNARLKQIENLTPCLLAALVASSYAKQEGAISPSVRPDLFPVDTLCEVVHAAGGVAIANIVKVTIEHWSGLPDDLFWKPLPCPECTLSCPAPRTKEGGVQVEWHPDPPHVRYVHVKAASPGFHFEVVPKNKMMLLQKQTPRNEFALLEVKSRTDKVRNNQVAFMRKIAGFVNCGIVYVDEVP